MANKENVVQSAVEEALTVYFFSESRGYYRFSPYANQQGIKSLRRYGADLIAMLDDAKVIMLEMKELDCDAGELRAFSSAQFEDCLMLESLGVPIAYCYNEVMPLAYYARPRGDDWPSATLAQVRRSSPSSLPGPRPFISAHRTLLDWLQAGAGEDVSQTLGRVLGAAESVDSLRNGVLILVYGVGEERVLALEPAELSRVLKSLDRKDLGPSQQRMLDAVFGESARIFEHFHRHVRQEPPPEDNDFGM